ncbi:transposase [Loktanella sp. SALINAS62]|nr:transposase [Loktanella sp. SALINAS62]
MDLHIGLDVSLASTAICVVSAQGKVVRETTAPSEPEDLVRMLNALPGCVVGVGLEAGPLSQWLYRHLIEAGFTTILMETRQVKGALQAMPIKTDRRDAEGIARLLQMGWFRPVHCKSMSAQEMRALLSSRKAIQQATLSLELSIRGVLRNFGLKMGQVAKGRFEQRVQELAEGNPMLEAAAKPILCARRALRQELAGVEKLLRDHAKSDPVCRHLMHRHRSCCHRPARSSRRSPKRERSLWRCCRSGKIADTAGKTWPVTNVFGARRACRLDGKQDLQGRQGYSHSQA